MKLAVMCVFLLGGCLDSDPMLAVNQSDLICDPFCDPGDLSYEEALQGAYSYGFRNFPDAVANGQSCADIGTSTPRWDCVVSLTTTSNPCGAVVVECLGTRCNWTALDGCQ